MSLPTLLLIHGVGDVPNERARRKSSHILNRDGSFRGVVWYDWNEAIEHTNPADPRQLTAIARATRLSARLEYPDRIPVEGVRRWLRRLARAAGWLQLPTMAVFLLSCLWLVLAWTANLLHEEPPLLILGVRLQHALFPPLDPVLLEGSIGMASATVHFAALALACMALMEITFTTAGGLVPFRVALRAAVLDVSRPLLAMLTAPGPLLATLLMLAAVLAFFLAVFSRPVQVVTPDGATVSWGAERLGLFLLPVAMLVSGVVVGGVSYLLRGFLKVVSDITRYLGDPEYRKDIHRHLDETLECLEPGPVVVVAHSLGSVIAVDSLLAHPEAWSRHQPVGLVTCGSPLRRLFLRFFPGSYETPDELARHLGSVYGDFHWRNVSRPLDYVGGRLSKDGSVTETRLHQRHHLHIAYWTDRQLVDPVVATASRFSGSGSQALETTKAAALPLERFQYGALHSPSGFHLLSGLIAAAGALLLIAVQSVWVPQQEREHVQIWQARLANEGIEIEGRLCPQRELDTTGEFPGYERAVAGITFTTLGGERLDLEAYAGCRPDINWDEVQKAVFGQVPSSALITGLRHMFFMKDPLLEIRDCHPVRLQYTRSDPRIFRLPPEFHIQPVVSGFRRTARIAALLIAWVLWWGLVHMTLSAVLGIAPRKGDEDRSSS
ncbi:MAG: hypothetical protein OEN20_00900 [Gammaproteobacteria bacterium]|nr:hypothetical protein [Gammaproteobacteria bacterium]